MTDRIRIGGYDINQPFLYDKFVCNKENYNFMLDTKNIHEHHYMEYAFVVIDPNEIVQNIYFAIQVNGLNIYSPRGYLYHNKIFPLEYENSFDNETNTVLKQMVRNNVPNVFFMPINAPILHNHIMICTRGMYPSVIANVYVKLGSERHRHHELDIYYPGKFFKSSLIGKVFGGTLGYGKKSQLEITANGDIVTNLYLMIQQYPNVRRIKNYYKMYYEIEIQYGHLFTIRIPTDYIALYEECINDICLNDLVDARGRHILPINLSQLVNIPLIKLKNIPLNLYFYPNYIRVFHHRIEKNVECIPYVNILPKEIWNLILNLLNCADLLNAMQACKLFYSIVPLKQIENLYDKYKVTIDDLEIYDMSVNAMYHSVDNDNDFDTVYKPTSHQIRNILQHKEVSMSNEYLLQITKSDPIEWIIIEFIEVSGLIEHVQFMPTDIDIMIPDTDFYLKMHNPPHRYLFYPKIPIECESIYFKFRANSTPKANIYLAFQLDIIF